MDVLKASADKLSTAQKIGTIPERKPEYISSYLFEIRKYAGALDFKRVSFHRNPEFDKFERNQYLKVKTLICSDERIKKEALVLIEEMRSLYLTINDLKSPMSEY